MGFKIKLEGLKALADGIDRVIEANSERGVLNNIHTLAEFAQKRMQQRTPGSGYLRSHWQADTTIRRTARGISASSTIRNTLAKTGVFYLSTDGTVKKKLRTFPSNAQQTYGEVIAILNAGSKSHWVAPKRKKFLSWWGHAPRRDSASGKFLGLGSDPQFSRGHFVRGVKPYGMLTLTAQDIRKLIESTVRDHTRNVIRAWAT